MLFNIAQFKTGLKHLLVNFVKKKEQNIIQKMALNSIDFSKLKLFLKNE